eukprot:scaffold119007_cov75-Phaeocystis_antarctica.AAC.1
MADDNLFRTPGYTEYTHSDTRKQRLIGCSGQCRLTPRQGPRHQARWHLGSQTLARGGSPCRRRLPDDARVVTVATVGAEPAATPCVFFPLCSSSSRSRQAICITPCHRNFAGFALLPKVTDDDGEPAEDPAQLRKCAVRTAAARTFRISSLKWSSVL